MRIQITSLFLLYWTAFASCAVTSLLQPVGDCDSQASRFKEGKTYYYSYDLENTATYGFETKFLLDIKCDIQLDAIGKCQYVLNTKDCRLFKEQNVLHEQSDSFSEQMAKYAVLFTMSQDNVTSVSAHENERIALLNIKKGIIATFQTVHVSELKEKSPIYRDRKDVIGLCKVEFKLESPMTVKSEIRMSNCIINRNFVNGGSACKHHFNDANDINNVSCSETYRFLLSRSFTKFSRTLTLIKTTPLVVKTESYLVDYRVTNIEFELIVAAPKSNPPDWKKTVITLIERMVELPHSPIESESFWLFDDLVDILLHSVDLESLSSGVDDCWGSPKCQSAKNPSANANRINFGHIWRDALIKCRSTVCIKAFKSFVTQSTASMADVLSDDIMEDIYHEWLIEGSTNPEFIYAIFDICQYRNQTQCYLAFSSIVHRFNWEIHGNKSKIPEKLKLIVVKTIKQIKLCESATTENWRCILSLKMLSNIGELAELVEPDLVNLLYQCATKSTTDWLISPLAVEALRRLKPSRKLYEHLLNIIKNPSLQQESRVNAYFILVNKWSEKAADDIDSILKSEAVDDTIKIFIYSHIKAVLRTQDHARIRLAEAFRKIVDNNTLEYFSYNTDDKLVSKYSEDGLFYISPTTHDPEHLYGLRWTESNLYDGTSFIPSSFINKLKSTFINYEHDFREVSVHSKGVTSIITLFLQHFFDPDYSVSDSVSKLKSLFSSQLKFDESKFVLDKLDKNIEHKLINIIKKLSASFNAKPSLLINSKTMGEEFEFADYSAIKSFVLRSLKEQSKQSLYRKNAEIVHGYPLILATSAGLPLTLFCNIDLMVVTNSKYFDHDSNPEEKSVVGFNSDIYSSFAVVAKAVSIVDILGFINKGYHDELFVAASGAIVADVSLDTSEGGTKAVRLELPANSKQAVVFGQQIVAFENNKRQLALDNEEKETSCYYLVPVCRTRKYEKGAGLPPFYNKWELQTPEKHPAVLLFKYISKDNETASSNHLSLSASSEGVKTSRPLLYLNYVHDKPKKTERIKVGSDLLPNFKLDATYDNEKLVKNAIQYKGSSTADFGVDYHYEMLASRFAKDGFAITRSPDAKKKPLKKVLGNFYIHRFVLLTPKGNFSLDYIERQYPINSERVLNLAFKCINTEAADWLRDILQMPAVWEDSETVKMSVFHKTDSILDHFESGVPEYRTHSLLLFPKYEIEVGSDSSIVDKHSVLSTLNLTSYSLPEDIPELSYKLSLLETSVKDEFNVSTNKILATFLVPHLKWIFSLDHQTSDLNQGLVLKVQRSVNEDDASGQLSKSHFYSIFNDEPPSNQEISFDFSLDSNNEYHNVYIIINFNYTGFPWLTTRSDPIGNIQLKLTSHEPFGPLTYSLSSALHDRALYGELSPMHYYKPLWTVFHDYHNMHLVDKANATIFQLIANSSNIFYYRDHYYHIYNFTSDVYTYLNRLNISTSEGVTIDYSTVAHPPEWNLLNVDLKHHLENGVETTVMKHALVDIEGEGTWSNGYNKTTTFNSKVDWISTMQWKLNCESIHKCVAQGTFTKPEAPTLFIVSELSPGKTELAFTICKNKICKDIATDPDYFVLKAVFSLIDPFTIVRTVTVNDPQFHKDFETVISNILIAIFRTTKEILFNPNHPVHNIYKHFVGISIEETFTRFMKTGIAVTELLTPDVAVTFGPVVSGIIYSSGPFSHLIRKLSATAVGLREINYQVRWLRSIYSSIFEVFRQRPGPYPGHSSVVEFQLPFALKNTVIRYSPIQLRPKTFYPLTELMDDQQVIHNVFYDEKYSRVALLIGNHSIRPFEGGLIRIHQPRCPQLLALDVEEQLFIIYLEDDWLHVILSGTHVQISYLKGQLMVDNSQHEFPFFTSGISVTRENHIVTLNTNSHLKIICDVYEHYCVFYTDVWKFGKLYGLLGNNTDAVLAQQSKISAQDYFSIFTLTDQSNSSCQSSDKNVTWRRPQGGCGPLYFWDLRYSTFICFDKIDPEPYLEVCADHDGDQTVTTAYVAACSALDVPVTMDYVWGYEFRIGREWSEFRDRKLVDVVFIVDQSLDLKHEKSYLKGLSNLVENIKIEFGRNSYSEIKFGLIGIRHRALWEPTFYTTKSQIWGSAEDFSTLTLQNMFPLAPSNDSRNSSKDLLDAIWLPLDKVIFKPQSARIIVLVTPQDPFDRVDLEDLYNVVNNLNSHQTTLYTISNYKELPTGTFGIVGNQLLKPKSLKTPIPTPPSGFNDLVPGHAARLALATKGAVLSLFHLESGHDDNQKEFLSEISVAMVNRAQQFLNKHYHCTCRAPKFLKPYSSCEFVEF